MRLGLSSAAAPDAGVDVLLAACVRRGLGALELRAGDAHGLDADAAAARGPDLRRRALESGVVIAGYRAEADTDARALAHIARALEAPAIIAGDEPLAQRIARAQAVEAEGGAALVAVRGPATEWRDAIVHAAVGCAWELDATATVAHGHLESMLRSAQLRSISLLGGGPEAAMHEGRGIGALMGALALGRYDGPLVLAPSAPRYRVAWDTWLGRRGGWGCGSKTGEMTALRVNGE